MMSSIFSPFDAAFEESFGLWGPIRPKRLVGSNSTSQDDVVATGTGMVVNQYQYQSSSAMMMSKTTAATTTTSPPLPQQLQQQQTETGEIFRKPESCRAPTTWTGPRFAVELDGVHCFETVLPF